MPLRRRSHPPAPPTSPGEWRPQRFGHGGAKTRDAIIEPSWGGVRVLARFDGTSTTLVDDEGVDCSAEFADVAEAISTAALAGELILDGFLTVEPTQPTEGTTTGDAATPTTGQMMTQFLVGSRVARMAAPERHLDPDRPVAFVAVDLLLIDGSSLLDIPLLERKRLLDGALAPTQRFHNLHQFNLTPPGSAWISAISFRSPSSDCSAWSETRYAFALMICG